MSWYDHTTSRRTEQGEIPGVYLPAIINNLHHYFTLLGVYKDGMINCWGLVTLDEFIEKTRWGWVTNSVPTGRTLDIHHLLNVSVNTCEPAGSIDDLIKDVRNAIEELNGRPTAQDRIIAAIKTLEAGDNSEARTEFLDSYSALPCYYRKYVFGSRMEKHKSVQELLRQLPADGQSTN